MRIPRIYQNIDPVPQTLRLDENAARHLNTVLRLKVNDKFILFNGDGHEYLAVITNIKKHSIEAGIEDSILKDLESPLKIHLGQAISKGERMDFTLQKATELGVTEFTPLVSTRSEVRLKGERAEKKQMHWQKVITSACEQCGRNRIPQLHSSVSLPEWVKQSGEGTKLILNHTATHRLKDISLQNAIFLLAGPEGGFTQEEKSYAEANGFLSVRMGPRVLRTETAALVAITALQWVAGDF